MNERVCGLDVGGTKLLAVAFDPADPLGPGRSERRLPTPVAADELVAAAVQAIPALLAESGGERLRAVGAGVAGLVDRDGRLRMGPNLPGIVDAPLRDRLASALGVPVTVDNDATAAAWGEVKVGSARDVRDAVVVTLGTGIGMGLVCGGQLVIGHHGYAGEAGHMVVDPDGPPCPCGRRGCWERYASGSGLGRLGRDAAEAGRLGRVVASLGGDPDAVRGEHVTAAAIDGDPEALAVVDAFAWWVALGLANLTNVVDPELFVIAGGLVTTGEVLLQPVRRAYGELLYGTGHRPPARVVMASLGEAAGAIGAGLRAADASAFGASPEG